MKCNIDFFIVARDHSAEFAQVVRELLGHPLVERVFLITDSEETVGELAGCCSITKAESYTSAKTLRAISRQASARYTALFLSEQAFMPAYRMIDRITQVADDSGALMVYTDRYELREGKCVPHPVIDYQSGSVRDDFDFGHFWLVRTGALHGFNAENNKSRLKFSALYALRLYLSRHGKIRHLREMLYTEGETDLRRSGERQFDYVNPAAREVQAEYEKVCTAHLKAIGAWLAPEEIDQLPATTEEYPVEASVIIPVRDRQRTIGDAIGSVLSQKADFDFNVIVVDNHSTDGTTETIRTLARQDARVVHVIPERTDLGIGGCWDLAIRQAQCGRYAVQLDSDDLYSGTDTLTQIVEAFRSQNAAMVIGAYRMVDFSLNTLPPGLIAHTEWTADNGRNNALRIGGLGAPRAFRTDLLRKIGFPNTSYGEDYAMGLAFSRHFRIARIFEELYLCRRWEGNSDAALPLDRTNAHNLYKDSLRSVEIDARRAMITRWEHHATQEEIISFFTRQMNLWDEARKRFDELDSDIQTRELEAEDYSLAVQFNPRRIVSTAARVDKKNLLKRPCFLCDHNRPAEQIALPVEGKFQILVNPFPILPHHLTIPTRRHQPQSLSLMLSALSRLAWNMPDFLLFYNGGRCGASAPDHAHIQAGAKGFVPLQRDWRFYENRLEKIYPLVGADEAELEEKGYNTKGVGLYLLHNYACPAFVLLGGQAEGDFFLLSKLLNVLPKRIGEEEADLNLLAWRQEGGPVDNDSVVMVLFPRRKHRPDCYFANGSSQFVISPGALDMGGLVITPREEDFERMTPQIATAILREVACTESQMRQIARRLHTSSARQSNEAFGKDTGISFENEPDVEVGILREDSLRFTLNGRFIAKGAAVEGLQEAACKDGGILWNGNLYSDLTFHPQTPSATFTIEGVTIGKDFHWQQEEVQTFRGILQIIVDEEKLVVVNKLPVEEYLESVISSEMRATSSTELLRAHAVISRSWLFSQMIRRRIPRQGGSFFSFVRKDDEYVRWYDREDHLIFDVCADDHCQRYQGITRSALANVKEAVEDTRGMVLMDAEGELCDARFSKCCGGITERFSTCWSDEDVPYLTAVRDGDNNGNAPLPDLTQEAAAETWIRSTPDSFCHTDDRELLGQVLNEYDQKTTDFYRWRIEMTQEELSQIIRNKREEDFGHIIDLQPVERGVSGRLKRLRIVGTKKTMIIGKELEIRRSLSPTHLYSSAFIVERGPAGTDGIPESFTLIGAGWGHGVGLCQIGAAAMSHKGYSYEDILRHYYPGATTRKLY